jgi:hypothetical protein
VTQQLHTGITEQVRNVLPCAGEKIVDTKDFVASFQKPFAEMRSKESSPSAHEYALGCVDRHVASLLQVTGGRLGASAARTAFVQNTRASFDVLILARFV